MMPLDVEHQAEDKPDLRVPLVELEPVIRLWRVDGSQFVNRHAACIDECECFCDRGYEKDAIAVEPIYELSDSNGVKVASVAC